MKQAEVKGNWLMLAIIVCVSSCKSYYIPVDSFKEQFAGMDKQTFKKVTVQNPWGGVETYSTFPAEYVKCVDKKGNPVELKKSPSLEIRFTDTNNKQTIFFFDRIVVTNSTVSGDRSRIINYKKTIPLGAIRKIEIQDGKKRYVYLD